MRLGGTWAVLALAGALAACGAPSSAPTVASGDSGGVASALTGFVGYDKLRPEQVEESSFVSDGDEPYVAVLRIRSTTGVKGSTKWAWVSDNPQETGSVKNGNEATIPDGTGDAWFDGALAVRPLEQTQFVGKSTNLTADVMVTIAFVFEGDRGDPAADVRILKFLTDPVVQQVALIIEGTQIPISGDALLDPSKTTAALKALMDSLKKVREPEINVDVIIAMIGRIAKSGFDPNDFVGVAATAFVPTTGQLTDTLRALGVSPSNIGLLDSGQGDGNQAWTNYLAWRKDHHFEVAGLSFGDGFIAGELWYGLLANKWVDDWMAVESDFPWQSRTRYWLKLTAAMR